MKKLLESFGVIDSQGKVALTNIAFYAVIARLCLSNPSIADSVFCVATLAATVVEKFFVRKNEPITDLAELRSDIDKLKLALNIKEFKR